MLADQIARMIEEMLEEAGGSLELQRNEMAGRLGCVPSQISYVLSSRFTPERGYIIESRRPRLCDYCEPRCARYEWNFLLKKQDTCQP